MDFAFSHAGAAKAHGQFSAPRAPQQPQRPAPGAPI
jgi:hypothetical protein